MNKHRVESLIAAAIFAAVGGAAVAADTTPASGKQVKTEYWMMDHSPADAKAMRLMSKPTQTSAAKEKVEYWTMDHSPADAKSMQRMGKNPEAKTQQGKVEHSMMDHSRADVKAMRGMKGPEKVVTVGE
jgi:hypothetical protein